MAVSRYSTPFQVSRPQTVVDFNMLDTSIGYKDARIDQGYLAVDSSIKQLNALDLIRPEDIEYRNRKVSELTANLNKYANQDLSDPKLVARLTGDAAKVVEDPELMSMLSSTKNARKLIERYQLLKENPKLQDKYSSINEQEDMEIYQNWIDGKTKTMSKSSPTFKYDTDKKASELLKTLAPKVYSSTEGLYNVQNEIRSESDLQRLAMGLIETDPEAYAQLRRNARQLAKGQGYDSIYNQAYNKLNNDITTTEADIITYQTRLKNASITKEERVSLEKRIDELNSKILPEARTRRADIKYKYEAGQYNPQEAEQLAFQNYADSWIKNVSQPFVVSKTKRTADQAAIFEVKRQDDFVKEANRMNFQAEQGQLDRQFKIEEEKMRISGQLAKEGKVPDWDEYNRTGKLIAIGDGSSIGGNGAFVNLPADSPERDYDVIKELTSRSTQLRDENKSILTNATLNIIKKTDPTLAGKLESIYKSNGDITAYKGQMSKAQVELLSQYDQLLDDANDPEKLRNNPALNQYGEAANNINLNLMKWSALDAQLDKAQRDVYTDLFNSKKFKGTYEQFIGTDIPKESIAVQALRNSAVSGSMAPGAPKYLRESDKYINLINERLRSSSLTNQFYRSRSINPDDKEWNDPSNPNGKYRTMLELGNQAGITMNGLNYSINGKRQANKAYRDNIDGVTQIRVDGLVPNNNQIRVTVMGMGEDDKKPKELGSGVMELNPTQMKDLLGRSSSDAVENIHPYLVEGTMQDKKGKPLYFNLNGDVPGMAGNVQYRFYDRGENALGLTVRVPVNGSFTELHLPELPPFEGADAHLKGKEFLKQTYQRAYQKAVRDNTGITSHEELSKIALKNLQDAFE